MPAARLTVCQERDDPAGVVRLHVATDRQESWTTAYVGQPIATSWSKPVRIGTDPQGRPVTLQTDEAHSLLAGQPGAGETSMARIVLAHYLLDSTAAV